MKTIIYKIAGIVFGMSWLASCSEQEFTTFQGEKTGIYMSNIGGRNQDGTIAEFVDSITFSFASYKDDEVQTTKEVTVRLMGNVVGYDRPFVLKVDESKSTAIRGTHFDFLESECIIRANQGTKNVPIIVYRHPDLITKTLRIELRLESNENFTTELENYKNLVAVESKGKDLCGSRFKLSFNEAYAITQWWEKLGTSKLGIWSASKEKRVNAIMGWTHAEWEAASVPYGRISLAAKLMQKELQGLANAGTPVVDDDGQYMQLGSAYRVNYSAYGK